MVRRNGRFNWRKKKKRDVEVTVRKNGDVKKERIGGGGEGDTMKV